MRLAIGGIAHESCTFSPLPMRLTEFTVLRGAALLARYPFLQFFPRVTAVPLLWAKGLPGGPVPAAVYHQLKAELLAGLETQGPWDGVYLDLHGALFVQGRQDAEADLFRAVRQVVGPDCPIAASYDLHGNLAAAEGDQLDLLTACRTAPHTDEVATRERAFRLLVQMIERGQRPFKTHLPLPLPDEQAMSTVEPGASLYQRVARAAEKSGVWDASLLVGYAWADEPCEGSSVVLFGEDETAVTHTAHELATAVWQARHDFQFGMLTGSIDDCIFQALAAPEPTVFISDAGDNPTGGGVGDVTAVLAHVLERRVPEALFASCPTRSSNGRFFRWIQQQLGRWT